MEAKYTQEMKINDAIKLAVEEEKERAALVEKLEKHKTARDVISKEIKEMERQLYGLYGTYCPKWQSDLMEYINKEVDRRIAQSPPADLGDDEPPF